MTLIESAIANLEKLLHCYSQQCDQVNFHKTWLELLAYQDVRDGVPRARREMAIHHVEYLDLYRQARQDAELLAGEREELESNP